MSSFRSIPIAFGAVVLLAADLSSAATPTTKESLVKLVDETMTAGDDQFYVYEMITVEPGKPERRMTFEVTLKGPHWRRVEFLAPGDVKGTRILVRSPTQMYVYLPAFRKIRRIASHVKEQGFMGSAWDHDEFSLAILGEIFEPKSLEDHGAYWTLRMDRRDGQDFVHHGIEVDVRKDINQPVELRYLNARGTVAKTERRLEFTCGGGFCSPKVVEMVDHGRNDLTTRMVRKEWKVNQGLQDSYFTVRALQRGT